MLLIRGWFTQRVYICLLLVCSVALMLSTYSRYQTVQSPKFLAETRKCILAKTARLSVKKLWESMHTIVNVCSSKNFFSSQHYRNDELDVDHIKTFTENFDCTIASYGLSQSFSVEQILSTEEPTCLFFAVDSDRNKGSHFKKIGEFFLEKNINNEESGGSAGQRKRSKRGIEDSETDKTEQDPEKAEVPIKEQDEEASEKRSNKNGKNNRKEKAEAGRKVIKPELDVNSQSLPDNEELSDSDKNDANSQTAKKKDVKETGLLKELNDGSTGLHNVVEKIELKNDTPKKRSDHRFKDERVPANITKSILSIDLETFLVEKVKRNLIYQLSINVANGFEALESLSSRKLRRLDICQVNIVLPKPTPTQLDKFASFFDDIMGNQYLTPMAVDFVGQEYTRFYFINPTSDKCLELFTFSGGQRG